ncbi:hypothetical protein ABBQ38_011107 [Trebouxia sp. C0009 RCD-2024]
MAPPESTTSTVQQSAVQGDFHRPNYLTKIRDYVHKVEHYDLTARQLDVNGLRHSGPQGKVEPLTVIDDPADWKAADLQGREAEYTYHLIERDVEELAAAVHKAKTAGVSSEQDILKLRKEDFPLPTLAPKLIKIGKEVNSGRGFKLVRGFPIQQYAEDRLGLVLAFWGMGLHLGRPLVSQTDYQVDGTIFGSVLNHVTDGRWATVYKAEGPDNRGRIDKSRLAFHTDQGATDLIALLSLSAAPEGGHSKWVSAIAIHNELLRRGRKDLVEVLSAEKTWYTPSKVSQQAYERNAEGEFAGFEEEVPFSYHDGYLSVHFEANKYQDITLTPLQEEAVWAVAKLAESPEFHISKKLQPGDIEIVHNPTIFHSRGQVIDGETPREKRHLLRWWIASDANKRPIPPYFAPRSNVQPTGGFRVPESSPVRLPLYPYSRHDGLGHSPAELE